MLTTLLPPTSGSAKVAGHDVVTEGAAVRDSIGAALQEAALDPQLTAREHMRLQGALHGIPKAERTSRGEELIERVGLTEAADRKVGGYSGGMKRRLDLALALLHGPRVLFLDEPTTGLDIQSRTALWDEVAILSRDEGVTVFLTTQYLEEADQLADHLGIIDHGRIVAGGTPQALKAEVGRPTVEVVPSRPCGTLAGRRAARALRRARPGTPERRRRPARRRQRGARQHRPRLRHGERADREPRAARSQPQRRLPREDRPLARGRTGRGGRGGQTGEQPAVRGRPRERRHPNRPPLLGQIKELARRSVMRTMRQPAQIVPATTFPLILLAINSAGLDSATSIPGFPTDSYLTFALAFAFLQAGVFAVIGTGQNLAEDHQDGFFNRMQLTPIHPAALVAGQLAGTLRSACSRRRPTSRSGCSPGADRGRHPRGARDDRPGDRDHARLRVDRADRRDAGQHPGERSRASSR